MLAFHGISMQIIKNHYIIWRLCGLWPQPYDKLPYRIYSITVNFTCLFLFNMVILLGLGQANDINDVIDILLPSTTTVLVGIKAILFVRNQAKIKVLVGLMQQLEASTVNVTAEQAILQRAKIGTLQLLFYISLGCYSAIAMSFSVALFSNKRKLMWTAWAPFEWEHTDSLTPYWCAMIFQFSCNFFLGIMYTTLDSCAPSLYTVLTAFLEILGDRLEKIGHHRNGSSSANGRNACIEEELYDCIRYHSLCLRYKKCLDDIFAVQYTVQFVASGLVICVTAFELSVVAPIQELFKFLFLVAYLLNMGIELFIPCYYGSLLSYKSMELSDRVFKCNWPEQSRRFKSALMIFIRGAQKPIVLYTVERIFAIALPSFVTISRAAYSLLSCLKGF